MAVREGRKHGDSNVSRNRKAESRAKGGPDKQEQKYPGKTGEMKPQPDHGEKAYVSSGKLNGLRVHTFTKSLAQAPGEIFSPTGRVSSR